MTSEEAYDFAKNNPGCDIEKYQEIACQEPWWAYSFARDVPGADIKYCQKRACKTSYYAALFAQYVPEADVEYCYNNSFSWRSWIIEFILGDLWYDA